MWRLTWISLFTGGVQIHLPVCSKLFGELRSLWQLQVNTTYSSRDVHLKFPEQICATSLLRPCWWCMVKIHCSIAHKLDKSCFCCSWERFSVSNSCCFCFGFLRTFNAAYPQIFQNISQVKENVSFCHSLNVTMSELQISNTHPVLGGVMTAHFLTTNQYSQCLNTQLIG